MYCTGRPLVHLLDRQTLDIPYWTGIGGPIVSDVLIAKFSAHPVDDVLIAKFSAHPVDFIGSKSDESIRMRNSFLQNFFFYSANKIIFNTERLNSEKI